MSEKVKLPKAVCDALDWAKSFGIPNETILKRVLNGHAIDKEFKPLLKHDFDTIMKALVLGYEPEETPEEKIYKRYINGFSMDYSKALFRAGIREALQSHGFNYSWLDDYADIAENGTKEGDEN